jgi:uncharacterized protein
VIALLDINMLIALFDAAHVHHRSAHAWLEKNQSLGWATCPITENGCIRVMSQPQYPGRLPVREIARRLAAAVAVAEHTFWSDSISICDSRRFNLDHLLTSKALTDVYLLGLAKKKGGRLVTFDRTISSAAVTGARAEHLLIL